MRDDIVVTNFTCQKKSMFGWVRYSTIYEAKFVIGNFVQVVKIPMIDGRPPQYLHTDRGGKEFKYTSKEEDGNYTFDLGFIKGDKPWHAIGKATVWSRGVSETNAGKCKIDITSDPK